MTSIHHRYGLLGLYLERGRKVTAFVALFICGATLGGYATNSLIRHFHQKALQSPIPKLQFVIEDEHWGGTYMVVRQGTTHLKLHCEKALRKDEKGDWQTREGGCVSPPVGTAITLEKWQLYAYSDADMYVYRPDKIEGEDDYIPFGEN